MRKCLLTGVLALAAILTVVDFAAAQLFRRGRGGYYQPGYSTYGPAGYGYDNNGNWGNWNSGNPNYYGSNNGYWSNGNWNDGSYRSFYPPNQNANSQFNQQDDRRGSNQQGQAFIMVRVSAPDTQVWFDDHRTQQNGMERFFETPPLQSGTYSYQIRAKWRENGKDMDKTRTVRVRPGQRVMVDFAQAGRQGEQLGEPRRGNQPNRSNQNQSDQNQNQSNQNQQNQNPQRQNENPPQQDR
jgi:uncharacterized protein (TIGR03000 family)